MTNGLSSNYNMDVKIMKPIENFNKWNTELNKISTEEVKDKDVYISEDIILLPKSYSARMTKRSLLLSFYHNKSFIVDVEKHQTWMKTFIDLLA